MPKTPNLMASKDVCLTLDINRSTLTRWVEKGKIKPAYRLPGDSGAFLFHPADVQAIKDEVASARAGAVA